MTQFRSTLCATNLFSHLFAFASGGKRLNHFLIFSGSVIFLNVIWVRIFSLIDATGRIAFNQFGKKFLNKVNFASEKEKLNATEPILIPSLPAMSICLPGTFVDLILIF